METICFIVSAWGIVSKLRRADTVVLNALLLLAACNLSSVAAKGKGPIGIYAISSEYVAVVSSNTDSLFVLDVIRGGVVGQLALHDPIYDPQNSSVASMIGGGRAAGGGFSKGWLNPISVATCDTCLYVYVSSNGGSHFSRIKLDLPLLSMAKHGDFSSLSKSKLEGRSWKPTKFVADSRLRHIAILRNGTAGFMLQQSIGLLEFDPLEIYGSSQKVKAFHKELPFKTSSRECALSLDERYLLTSIGAIVYRIDLTNKDETASVEQVDVGKLCGTTMSSVSLVQQPDESTLFVLVKGQHGKHRTGVRKAVYELGRVDSGTVAWSTCVLVAGNLQDNEEGWRDGTGKDAQFTRPHDMVYLPGLHSLALTDIDNRAVRLVDVSSDRYGHVSTIWYEDMMQTMYGISATSVVERLPPTQQGISSVNLEQASLLCLARDSRLCNVHELRSSSNDNGANLGLGPSRPSIVSWTLDSCASCWLPNPGFCDFGLTKRAITGFEEHYPAVPWGLDYNMVVRLSADGALRTECTHQSKVIEGASHVCCREEKLDIKGPNLELARGANGMELPLTICFILLGALLGVMTLVRRRHHGREKYHVVARNELSSDDYDDGEVASKYI